MQVQVPVRASLWLSSLGLVVLGPLALTAGALWLGSGSLLGPADTRGVILAIYTLIAVGGVVVLLSMTRNSLTLADDGQVTLRGAFYTRGVDSRSIDARSIATPQDGRPPVLKLRTNGIGLPGYQAGWFRDDQGAKAFVVYAGGPWVSFGTRDGVRHVIGSSDPERLAAALKAAAGGGAGSKSGPSKAAGGKGGRRSASSS